MADLVHVSTALPDATTGEGRQMEPDIAVVAVPLPAQGHLNPMLHLSLQLASRGFALHYAAPAAQLQQARARVQGWGEGALLSVEFHELGISEYVSPPPDPTAPTPFPLHLMPLFEAYTASARAPLAALLGKLSASHRRVIVVHDYFSAFAAEEAARLPNGVAFELSCLTLSILAVEIDGGLRLLRERGLASLSIKDSTPMEFFEFVKRARPSKEISLGAGILVNTCRALDGELVDVVSDHLAAHGKKFFAVGPLNPLLPAGAPKQQSKSRHECLDWLDEQPPSSVLYVAFGTTATLRKEQVADLAAALRDSNQRFIWVLRDSDRGDIFADDGESRHAALLSEFTKQTQGRGLVITGWAPQLEILAHDATAAFMNHCGWNSTIESLGHGKPILAWPMHGDHPWDAELVCKHLKAGILVRPWEKHGHDELVPAAVLTQVIQDAMLSDDGMAVRQRAMVIRDAIRASLTDGGSSSRGLDGFIAHITMRSE